MGKSFEGYVKEVSYYFEIFFYHLSFFPIKFPIQFVGVSDNASFYVFTHAPDGAIEAYPLNEWYNFQPIQRYKTLSAEEAEQELSNRKKTLNLFALMFRKRMKGDDEQDPELEGDKKKGPKKKDLTISEIDEWIESDEGKSF